MGKTIQEVVKAVPQSVKIELLRIGVKEQDTLHHYRKLLAGEKITCGGETLEILKVHVNPVICAGLISAFRYYRDRELDLLEYSKKAELLAEINEVLGEADKQSLDKDFVSLYNFDLIELRQREIEKEVYEVIPDQYRLSEIGERFVKKELGIPRTALLFQGNVIGHITDPWVMIDQVLKENEWDYKSMVLGV